MFSHPGAADYEIVEGVLDELGIGKLADRVYTELSGGERQMVLIARALAQQPEYLFMGAPTSNLDFGNQVSLVRLAKELTRDRGSRRRHDDAQSQSPVHVRKCWRAHLSPCGLT